MTVSIIQLLCGFFGSLGVVALCAAFTKLPPFICQTAGLAALLLVLSI
jgi:hypothetical protein